MKKEIKSRTTPYKAGGARLVQSGNFLYYHWYVKEREYENIQLEC